MSATTARPSARRTGPGVSFGGILRSEWIKLITLRSTAWFLVITAVVTIGLDTLVSIVIASSFRSAGTSVPAPTLQTAALQGLTISVGFTQLIVLVLGALVITGEFGTGMIRSTFTAVPARIPAVLGKALVFALVVFLVAAGSLALSAVISAAVFAGAGLHPDLGDPAVLGALLGAAGYLALIGVFAFALGAIIRASAGAIGAALGVVLVLPPVLGLVTQLAQAAWVGNIAKFLPGGAATMYAYEPTGGVDATGVVTLNAWEGLALIVAWDVVLLVVGSILIRRRDV